MADSTKIGFEKQIWDAVYVLWGHMNIALLSLLPMKEQSVENFTRLQVL